jgi:hypothetical protein
VHCVLVKRDQFFQLGVHGDPAGRRNRDGEGTGVQPEPERCADWFVRAIKSECLTKIITLGESQQCLMA